MKKDTSKSTILVISMGFIIIHLLFKVEWALFTALGFGMAGVISDTLSQKIEWAWMKLAHVLSKIIPTILLAAVFFLVLFPISLISKLFTKDPLMLSPKYKSYFVDINKTIDKKSMENIW